MSSLLLRQRTVVRVLKSLISYLCPGVISALPNKNYPGNSNSDCPHCRIISSFPGSVRHQPSQLCPREKLGMVRVAPLPRSLPQWQWGWDQIRRLSLPLSSSLLSLNPQALVLFPRNAPSVSYYKITTLVYLVTRDKDQFLEEINF